MIEIERSCHTVLSLFILPIWISFKSRFKTLFWVVGSATKYPRRLYSRVYGQCIVTVSYAKFTFLHCTILFTVHHFRLQDRFDTSID